MKTIIEKKIEELREREKFYVITAPSKAMMLRDQILFLESLLPLCGEWVSVKDKLPDKYQIVLCIDADTNYYFPLCRYDEGRFYKAHPALREMTGYYNGVTHWQPLPPAPQTKKEGEK